MQKYKFKVTFEDDTEKEAAVDQRDIRRWEAETERSWLVEEMTITSATKIAYYALNRSGAFTGSWEDFDKVAVWVEEVNDEKPRPTPKRRTGGSS